MVRLNIHLVVPATNTAPQPCCGSWVRSQRFFRFSMEISCQYNISSLYNHSQSLKPASKWYQSQKSFRKNCHRTDQSGYSQFWPWKPSLFAISSLRTLSPDPFQSISDWIHGLLSLLQDDWCIILWISWWQYLGFLPSRHSETPPRAHAKCVRTRNLST